MSFVDSATTQANSIIGDSLVPYALISIPSRYVADIMFDVTVEEVHTDRLEATQHPIQTGAVVTDHSFALPATLTIRAGSSDSSGGYLGYSREVYDYFLALQASRQPFSVTTGKRAYDNMIVRDLTVTTDPSSEFALLATINLQQLTFTDVDSQSTSLNPNAQAIPSETTPTLDMGVVSLKPVANAPNFVQYMNLFQPVS